MASTAVHASGNHPTTFSPLVATTDSKSQSHDVSTTLHYYKDPGDGSAPAPSIVGKIETYERPSEPTRTTVHDVRGREQDYKLDKQGFEFYKHASAEKKFDDDDKIKREYYAEVEQLLKNATGASRVFIFDHTIRRPLADADADAAPGAAPTLNPRGPVNRVHIDQSYRAARDRVPHHLPGDADALLRSRHQIINVWRPIRKILKDPLGVADAHSVPDTDLVPVGLIYPDRAGETYTVRPGKGHQWYYLYGQDVDEVTLIKCFDSKVDGRARRVPHTAFTNPAHEDDYARESIEVRCLVFHEHEDAE